MARISENNKGRIRTEFDSVRDVLDTVRDMGWEPKRYKASDSQGTEGGFYAFNSLDQALDVYRNNPESIRQFDNSDIKLESIESPGRDVYFDITGDYLDIGRFMDGEPEVMGNATMGNPRSVFATINISIAKVHYTSNEYVNRMQRRVLRLVDWLESQSIRCQIVATSVSECANISIIVKQFTDPVDLNDLAIVCHSDFFRRVTFLIKEQSKTWSSGYGNSISYDKRMIDYAPQPEDGLYIYIGGYIPFSSTAGLDKAFNKIEDQVQELIENEQTWNEEPLSIGGRTKKEW